MFQAHPLGHIYQKDRLTVFFGNREGKTEAYRKTFPQWKFTGVKQVHGNAVQWLDRNSEIWKLEGDASVTNETNLGLCVVTADCMPVFIYNSKSEIIAGVHAGWRGIASRVIPETIKMMKSKGADPTGNTYFIGPHILKSSFEVDNKVRDDLLQSSPLTKNQGISEAISDAKSLVDLLALAEAQIQEFATDSRIIKHVYDTKSDQNYHSFRRDREKSGRQVSFVCLS